MFTYIVDDAQNIRTCLPQIIQIPTALLSVIIKHVSDDEMTWNANLMQLSNFIDVFLSRHVSGTYAHHQEHWMLSCSIWFSAPSFWMGGGLESSCVGRVYGADGAWQRPHRTHDLRSCSQDHHSSKKSVHKTIRCNSTPNAPDDGRMCPKHVEIRIHQ